MKNKKIFNFTFIGLSFIFIFNPNINVIDLLPDFIGYILLCVALTSLGDINDDIADAIKAFKRMIFIDASKILAVMWIFGLSALSERNSSLMLFSFVYGILEMFLLIPAYAKLFGGLATVGYFHNNTSIIGTKKESKRNYTDRVRAFTTFFVIFKATMSFLPELADLTSTEYYENSGATNLYRFIGIMRFLAFIPVMIVGIIWLVNIIKYFRRLEKDQDLKCSLEVLYDERVAPKKGIFIKRNVQTAFVILITALVLSFDLRIESVNILPDALSALLFAAFFVVVSKKTAISTKWGMRLSGAYFAISAAYSYIEYKFFREYSYGIIYRDTVALKEYKIMVAVSILSIIAFLLLCVSAIMTLEKIIDTHTGVIIQEDTPNATMLEKMSEDTRTELKKHLTYCMIAVGIYSVGDVCYTLFAKDYGFLFLINCICAVIFVGTFVKTYSEIYEAVNAKYMLE